MGVFLDRVSLSWVLRSIIWSLWVLSSLFIFSVVFSASFFCCVVSFVDLSSSFSSSFICFFAVCSWSEVYLQLSQFLSFVYLLVWLGFLSLVVCSCQLVFSLFL